MSRFESREKMKNSSSFPGNDSARKPSAMKRNTSLSAPSSGSSLQTLWETGDESDSGKVCPLNCIVYLEHDLQSYETKRTGNAIVTIILQ